MPCTQSVSVDVVSFVGFTFMFAERESHPVARAEKHHIFGRVSSATSRWVVFGRRASESIQIAITVTRNRTERNFCVQTGCARSFFFLMILKEERRCELIILTKPRKNIRIWWSWYFVLGLLVGNAWSWRVLCVRGVWKNAQIISYSSG